MARQKSVLPQLLLFLTLVVIVYAAFRYSRVLLPPRGARHTVHLHYTRPERRARALTAQNGVVSPHAAQPQNCSAVGVSCTSDYFAAWTPPSGHHRCRPRKKRGYYEPDRRCTPGGVNPTVTLEAMRNPAWRTGCVRNCESSESQKHVTYRWYGLTMPAHNTGADQVCELDHVVPLELGGADGLGNIWPQCGPDEVTLNERYFKIKDRVENYLADEVRAGRMPLDEAQRGIAKDWTQYLPAANAFCQHSGKC